MRTAGLTSVLVGLVSAMGASGASATAVDGSCAFSGTNALIDPYTFVPRGTDYEAAGSGSCVGTLDRKTFDGPASLYVDGHMDHPMSCALGAGAGVPGTVTFGGSPNDVDATQLDLLFTETHAGSEGPLVVAGAYNGQAVGRLSFTRHVGPDQAEACAGSGLSEVGFDVDFRTITQLYG